MSPDRAFATNRRENLVSVGAVASDWARVWMRLATPGRYRIVLSHDDADSAQHIDLSLSPEPGCDGTLSVMCGKQRPLVPGSRYRGLVQRADANEVVGRFRFETAPTSIDDCPDQFAIAVMSCHQPFDGQGCLVDRALKALDVLEEAFEAHAVKRVLMLGDQMYADYPKTLSLFDAEHFRRVGPRGRRSIFECTREEVRQLLQDRYRIFFGVEQFASLQRNFPCYLVPDDHELCDNFGSHPDHASIAWSSFREGALDACYDYEGLRTRTRSAGRPSLHFSFEYGPLACFVMDLRSEKRATSERVDLYGEGQFLDLKRYLFETRHYPFLLLGLSVPFVHLPEWLTTFGDKVAGEDSDAADRWTHARARESWANMLRLLHEHQRRYPEQRVVLLGGDVHTGVATELSWAEPELRLYQLVSSAVSNLENPLFRKLAETLPKLASGMTVANGEHELRAALMRGVNGHQRNPYSGLNVGIVHFVRVGSSYQLRFKLVGHDDNLPPRPRVVFESAPL